MVRKKAVGLLLVSTKFSDRSIYRWRGEARGDFLGREAGKEESSARKGQASL